MVQTQTGSAVAFVAPEQADVVEEDLREPGPGEVLVQTAYSGISAGTELAFWRGTNPYLQRRWDADRRLFVAAGADGETSSTYPMVTGYEEVGRVVASGSGCEDLEPGTAVYGTWGHRSHAIVPAEQVRPRLLPEGAPAIAGIFSHIGAVALNGVLDAGVRLGETVAVFGLGTVGQVACQLLRLSGARVIGVDLVESRRELARELGAHEVIDGRGAAERIRELTGGRGADVCIEAAGAVPALHEAVRAVAHDSTVVALGFFQGGAEGLRLGEEFHHNRVRVFCSQIGAVAPERAHRWDRLRLVHTVLELATDGRLDVERLVSHYVTPAEAPAMFRTLAEDPAAVLQSVIDFTEG